MSIAEHKDALRARMKAAIAALPEASAAAGGEAAAQNLLSLPEYGACGTLFCYCSVKKEVDTRQILAFSLGMKIFTEMLQVHRDAGGTVFSGDDAFKLYDTYGFPIDLTVEMAGDEGLTLDKARFDALMDEQKATAREARRALGDLAWAGIDLGLDNTPTAFTGYGKLSDRAGILAMNRTAEKALLAGHDLSGTELLIAGHHGSKNSTGSELLAETGAQTAIISVGYNTYGHPTNAALARLYDAGAAIYRTDLNGNVTVRTN